MQFQSERNVDEQGPGRRFFYGSSSMLIICYSVYPWLPSHPNRETTISSTSIARHPINLTKKLGMASRLPLPPMVGDTNVGTRRYISPGAVSIPKRLAIGWRQAQVFGLLINDRISRPPSPSTVFRPGKLFALENKVKGLASSIWSFPSF